MIPSHQLPHTVTVVTPASSTDGRGDTVLDYGAAATRVTLAPGSANDGVWLQQDQRAEAYTEGRQPIEQRWLMMSNYRSVTAADRVEWTNHRGEVVTFTVEGEPEPTYRPTQPGDDKFHHLETTLRIQEG